MISHLATRTLPLLARGAQGGLLLADAHSGTSGAQYIGNRPCTLGQSRHVTSTLLVGQAGTTAGTRPLSHTAGTMITQFFVLSPRGDTIISKQCACGGNAMCWRVVRVQAHVVLGGEFNAMGVRCNASLWHPHPPTAQRCRHTSDRGDAVRGIAEIFFRKVKFWGAGDAPPVFVRIVLCV